MGCICSEERDKKEAKSQVPGPPSPASPPASAPVPAPIDREEQVCLLATRVVTHLTEELRAHYKVTARLKPWRGNQVLSAQYLTTEKPCMIVSFPRVRDSSRKMRGKVAAFEAMMSLDHPHIRKIYEVKQNREWIYLVTEYTENEFADYMQEKTKIPENLLGKIAVQLLKMLCYVHSLGKVHGSLRPDCIGFQTLPEIDVNIKVCAFFSEEWTVEDQLSVFDAPEVRSQQAAQPADIWSCGVILYYALMGKFPYNTLDEVRCKKIKFNQGISKEAVALLKEMLNLNPENRPDASSCLTSAWIRRYTGYLQNTREVHQHINHICEEISVSSLRRAVLYFIVDRAVPQGEIAKVAKTFLALDVNGDGLLSKEELLAGIRMYMTETDAQEKLQSILISAQNSEVVDYSAFVVAAIGPHILLSEANLKAAFRSLDADDSGCISLHELKKVFKVVNNGEDQKVWQRLLAQVDTSGDGEIDEFEFRKLMKRAAE